MLTDEQMEKLKVLLVGWEEREVFSDHWFVAGRG